LQCFEPSVLGGVCESDDAMQWVSLQATRDALVEVEKVGLTAPLSELSVPMADMFYVMDDQHLGGAADATYVEVTGEHGLAQSGKVLPVPT
jgi:hypothetical protein